MFCPIMPAVSKVYGLWITLLFRLVFGTTSLEKGSRNLLLDCSLLVGDATFPDLLESGLICIV